MVKKEEQIPLFPEKEKKRRLKVVPEKKEAKKKLTPEQKKNIQWFWRIIDFEKKPVANLIRSPIMLEEDIDAEAKRRREWAIQAMRFEKRYKGQKEYNEKDLISEIALKDMKTVPVGKFYQNLREIDENAKIYLLKDRQTNKLNWYFGEEIKTGVTELRKFSKEGALTLHNYPQEIKDAIIKIEQ